MMVLLGYFIIAAMAAVAASAIVGFVLTSLIIASEALIGLSHEQASWLLEAKSKRHFDRRTWRF